MVARVIIECECGIDGPGGRAASGRIRASSSRCAMQGGRRNTNMQGMADIFFVELVRSSSASSGAACTRSDYFGTLTQ